ncbi:Kunitz/Bovine pancreatic trypsin inhibitor domain protein [Cooperia oncophora]
MRCLYVIEKGNCSDKLLRAEQFAMDLAECNNEFCRYAFDRNLKKCVTFMFSGCGGNTNRYPTLQRCQRTCLKGIRDLI